jgi:hypothetical protein
MGTLIIIHNSIVTYITNVINSIDIHTLGYILYYRNIHIEYSVRDL